MVLPFFGEAMEIGDISRPSVPYRMLSSVRFGSRCGSEFNAIAVLWYYYLAVKDLGDFGPYFFRSRA